VKLDHIVLLLSDVEECIGFYDRLLPAIGFEKLRDHVFTNSDGIHLDFRPASKPEHGYHRFAPGLNHLGFTAGSRQEVERIGSLMSAAGFEVPAIQEYEDGIALFLRDADGMRVELSTYK
jgi:catechol 2,3-dioxygenase-like lactoylglutathione lyase family enzyme